VYFYDVFIASTIAIAYHYLVFFNCARFSQPLYVSSNRVSRNAKQPRPLPPHNINVPYHALLTKFDSSNKAAMSEATPRITASYLEHFSHQTVRMLGKVKQLRGESATIDAGGSVNIHLTRVSPSLSLHTLRSLEARR